MEEEALSAGGLGTEIADLFIEVGLKADVPELRGCVIKPLVVVHDHSESCRKEYFQRRGLTAAAKASSGNGSFIAAVNRCATQETNAASACFAAC